MKKTLFTFILSSTIAFAASGLVDAIALVVNDTPITLYDIEKRKAQANVSKEEAVSQLVDEALFEELVRKNNITADIFDVNNYLEKVAASNGMDLYAFKSIIKQKYPNYEAYEEQTKKQIIRQKLTDKLVRGNLKIATAEDLKIYYDNNINQFQSASNVKAIQYASKNKANLEMNMKNPMATIENVTRRPIDLDQTNLNPQLRYIINETNVNQFTPVFTANQEYTALMIVQKENTQTLAFEEVKDKIFNIVMQDRESKYLKDYFEKLKLSADIKIVR